MARPVTRDGHQILMPQRAWSTRVAATALGQVDARSQNRPIARAIGTYVAGIVRRNSVPITTHDHQSLSPDMTLAPIRLRRRGSAPTGYLIVNGCAVADRFRRCSRTLVAPQEFCSLFVLTRLYVPTPPAAPAMLPCFASASRRARAAPKSGVLWSVAKQNLNKATMRAMTDRQ